MKNIFRALNRIDLFDFIKQKYNSISDVDKKAFWILFFAINFTFIFNTIHFLWGDHDWSYLGILRYDTYLFEARYSATVLQNLLFGGEILPIINSLVSFALLAIGTLVLISYWGGGGRKIR